MRNQFKIGDRVVGIGSVTMRDIDGLVGTIVGKSVCDIYLVQFDYDASKEEEVKYASFGWFVKSNQLKPLEQ